jgi:hypothetical protein
MIQILSLAIGCLLLYAIYIRFGKYFKEYVDDTLSYWPKLPSWVNWVLGIFLFFACTVIFFVNFNYSIAIWFGLLLVMPFALSISPGNKLLNRINVVSFLVSLFFSLVLFGNIDRTRDFIGHSFISNYKVEYKTVKKHGTTPDGDPEDWEEEEPFFYTGNPNKDYFLKTVFPIIYY